MKSNMSVVLGVVIMAGVGLGVGVLNQLREPRVATSHQTIEQVELARRIFDQHDPQLSFEAAHRDVMGGELLTESKVYEDVIASTDLQAKADGQLSNYTGMPSIRGLSDAETELLTLRYGPDADQHRQPSGRRSFSDAMVKTGVTDFEKHFKQNQAKLKQALDAVDNALANASTHASANRLKGMIMQEQAVDIMARLQLLRRQLADQRSWVVSLLNAYRSKLNEREVVAQSDINSKIATAEESEREMAQRITAQEAVVKQLEAKTTDMSEKLAGIRARSEASREAMEKLEDVGVDLSDPNGFEVFRDAYEQQATSYRVAIREAHVLEYGTLDNARIDQTGDFIEGSYEAINDSERISRRRGLVHFQHDLEIAAIELERMQEAKQNLDENIQSLKDYRTELEKQANTATQFVEAKRDQLLEAYSGFQVSADVVAKAEDDVIEVFRKAAGSFGKAVQGVSEEESAASQDRFSPDRSEFHYSSLAGDQRWYKGHISAQQGEATLRMAEIMVGRFLVAGANRDLVTMLEGIVPIGEDRNRWSDLADSAKKLGGEQATDAISKLERAMSQVGDGNWTVAAELGAANFLLSILGDDAAGQKAVAWYDSAIDAYDQANPADQGVDEAREHRVMRDFVSSRQNDGQ